MKKYLSIAAIIGFTALAQDQNMPEKIELKTETVNAVLQYLSQKPYAETAGLIQKIQVESSEYVQALNAKKDKAKK